MKITIDRFKTIEQPFSAEACTGYIAQSIEITAQDVKRMRIMAERNPKKFEQCMLQLEARFVEQRLKNVHGTLKDVTPTT